MPKTDLDTKAIVTRFLRESGTTHAEFGEAADVSEKQVGRWVSGENRAPVKKVARAIERLGHDPRTFDLPLSKPIPFTPPVDETGTAALDSQLRHDVAMIRARMELMMLEVTAIREHFGITAPTKVAQT